MGDVATGRAVLRGNCRQSYDVDIRLEIDGEVAENSLDLKNPYFRYGGQAILPPPGQATGETSPSEAYWASTAQPTSYAGITASPLATSFVPANVGLKGAAAAPDIPFPTAAQPFSAASQPFTQGQPAAAAAAAAAFPIHPSQAHGTSDS